MALLQLGRAEEVKVKDAKEMPGESLWALISCDLWGFMVDLWWICCDWLGFGKCPILGFWKSLSSTVGDELSPIFGWIYGGSMVDSWWISCP